MSATADKARYFLEQSVPELKEYERKKIFSPEEITSIAKKRSDFEHKINARGSFPSDYAQYAEFEINVDALRKKRVKRMGIKSTAHNGQRRVFFVFDRGTRKFPGDIGLWMQSIDYTRHQKAFKRLTQIFTNILRLHPSKPELWIYAAQFSMDENGDVLEARSYMQRGLRFCKNCRKIWLQYVRLELAYMTKLLVRKQILGAGKVEDSIATQPTDTSEDILRLPNLGDDDDPDVDPKSGIDPIVFQGTEETSAMSGAIPLAIFDAAMDQFQFEAALGHEFFDLVADFDQLPVLFTFLDHIVEVLSSHAGKDWQTQACLISRPLAGMSSNQPEYPVALRETLRRIQDGLVMVKQKAQLVEWCKGWLQQQIHEDMDPALLRVLQAQVTSLSS